MKVTFTRTGERRYRVSVEGDSIEALYMEPAPGYDARLPHDAAHFIVENELGIGGAVFGQLAAGGTAKTFRSDNVKNPRRAKKRGLELSKAHHKDAVFSEHAVYAAQSRWLNAEVKPDTDISTADIKRICAAFDEFSSRWSELPVGGSIELVWKHHALRTRTKK